MSARRALLSFLTPDFRGLQIVSLAQRVEELPLRTVQRLLAAFDGHAGDDALLEKALVVGEALACHLDRVPAAFLQLFEAGAPLGDIDVRDRVLLPLRFPEGVEGGLAFPDPGHDAVVALHGLLVDRDRDQGPLIDLVADRHSDLVQDAGAGRHGVDDLAAAVEEDALGRNEARDFPDHRPNPDRSRDQRQHEKGQPALGGGGVQGPIKLFGRCQTVQCRLTEQSYCHVGVSAVSIRAGVLAHSAASRKGCLRNRTPPPTRSAACARRRGSVRRDSTPGRAPGLPAVLRQGVRGPKGRRPPMSCGASPGIRGPSCPGAGRRGRRSPAGRRRVGCPIRTGTLLPRIPRYPGPRTIRTGQASPCGKPREARNRGRGLARRCPFRYSEGRLEFGSVAQLVRAPS